MFTVWNGTNYWHLMRTFQWTFTVWKGKDSGSKCKGISVGSHCVKWHRLLTSDENISVGSHSVKRQRQYLKAKAFQWTVTVWNGTDYWHLMTTFQWVFSQCIQYGRWDVQITCSFYITLVISFFFLSLCPFLLKCKCILQSFAVAAVCMHKEYLSWKVKQLFKTTCRFPWLN